MVLDGGGAEVVAVDSTVALRSGADLRAVTEALPGLRRTTDRDAVEHIRELTALSHAVDAARVAATADLDRLRRQDEAARGVPEPDRGKGLGAEVALARSESPARGDRHLKLALTLVHDLPHTLHHMSVGAVSEWRAGLVAQETTFLSPPDRRDVDATLAPQLGEIGDARVAQDARAIATGLDPDAAEEHRRRRRDDRHVAVRSSHGGMARLSALLPTPDAVRVHALLTQEAGRVMASGRADGRTRSQISADLLVQRASAPSESGSTSVDLVLVMNDHSFFPGDDSPATLPGHGPVPAAMALDLITDEDTLVWVRRLFTDPVTGDVVKMDSRARSFPAGIRRAVAVRDGICRTPFCDAPIAEIDHVRPWSEGGRTSLSNASGLCARCNRLKSGAGWRHEVDPDGLTVITPTGTTYAAANGSLSPRHRVENPRPSPGAVLRE